MLPGQTSSLKAPPWRLLFWACAAAVLALSLMPPSQPLPTTGWDKSNHLLAFGVLALLGRRAFAGHGLSLLLVLVVYGGVIELLQGMTAYREADWLDLVADACGVLAGLALDWLWRGRGRRWPR
ncbi:MULTISPECIES: VanZ family protein [Cupriavidus]|uniref:VanZ family protein n=1 Tax=Cupriavidus oxalaticus TaxID=96344 RepID=A0A4V1BYT1_9BURK|nr:MULTISPECIES: VanZ family protein [Cupriavidus]MBF6991330.1 VanZ family protein [Cupriavidus sp. IK-TO18]QBY52902.1 VanZ family protein [Cupriavidus oxalaticus]